MGYTVGDYLRDRLVETGADRVLGVPGDYTLALLDYLIARPELTWLLASLAHATSSANVARAD